MALALGVGLGLGLGLASAAVPGLHPYNLVTLLVLCLQGRGPGLGEDLALGLGAGVAAGYAVFHLAPAVFYQTADEGAAGLLLPAQKALREGRGLDAVRWSGWGAWGALMVLTLGAWAWPRLWSTVHDLLDPHLGWILLALVAFLLLSEWPWGAERLPTPGRRLGAIGIRLGVSLLVFFLSGILGGMVLARNPLQGPLAGAPLVPAFLGLFAVPGLLQGGWGAAPPAQDLDTRERVSVGIWARGMGTGLLGGAFAVALPGVTAGVGGLLAGHATAQRDDRAFLVAQGAARAFYVVGSFWLALMPEGPRVRGGLALLLAPWLGPAAPDRYLSAVAATALAGALAFGLLEGLARAMARRVARPGWRWTYRAALLLLGLAVGGAGGIGGLAVLIAATGIGLLPVAAGTRRLHTLGVILVPLLLRRLGLEAVLFPGP